MSSKVSLPIVGILIVAGLLLVPDATALTQWFTENFESQTVGTVPSSGTGWSFTSSDASTMITTAQAHTGTKSLQLGGNNPGGGKFILTNDLCAGDSFDMWAKFTTLPATGTIYEFYFEDSSGGNAFPTTYYIDHAGTIFAWVSGSTQISASGAVTANVWNNYHWTYNCVSGVSQFTSSTFPGNFQSYGGSAYSNIKQLIMAARGSNPTSVINTSNIVFIDDIGSSSVEPAHYVFCVAESGTCTFSGVRDAAYGANGAYFYRTGLSSFTCNSATFGGDPAVGTAKNCYVLTNNLQLLTPTPSGTTPGGDITFSSLPGGSATNHVVYTIQSGSADAGKTCDGHLTPGINFGCTITLDGIGAESVLATSYRTSDTSQSEATDQESYTVIDNTLIITAPTEGQTVSVGNFAFTVSYTGQTPDHVIYTLETGETCNSTVGPTFSCTINLLTSGANIVDACSYDISNNCLILAENDFTVNANPNTVQISTPTESQHFSFGSTISFTSTVTGSTTASVVYTLNQGPNTGHTCTGTTSPTYACSMSGLVSDLNPNTAYAVSKNSAGGSLATSNARSFYLDNAGSTGNIHPISTRTISGGAGFHVDPTGSTIISREGTTGNIVNTYAGGGNMPLLGNTDTNCVNRADGVYGLQSHVLYLQCETDGATVHSYNIRSASLGDPIMPGACTDPVVPYCVKDILDAAFFHGALAGNHDKDDRLTGFEDFPINYQSNQNDFGDKAVWMAFAFTTKDGNVGVVTYVMNGGSIGTEPDFSAVDVRNIGSVNPTTLCEVTDTTGATAGQSYLYAADQTSNVHGYHITWTNNFNVLTGSHELRPHMTEVFSGTAQTAGPRGIGCGNGKFAVVNESQITVWERGATAPMLTIPITDGQFIYANGAVEMTADGGWIAYTHNTGTVNKIEFYNSTTGFHKAAAISAHVGFAGMGLQGKGCTAWMETPVSIERFNLVNATGAGLCLTDKTYVPPQPTGAGNSGGVGSGTNTNSAASDVGGSVVAGSGCLQHYNGQIKIGATYVPILDWTNCASMITESAATILSLLLFVMFAQTRLNRNKPEDQGGMSGNVVIVCCFGIGYFVSMYLWQAPFLLLVPVTVVSAAVVGFRARRAVA